MNLDVGKLTELLQKRYNIPIRELKAIYEISESQTAKGGQADLRVMQGSSSADAKSELLPCPFCGDKVKAEKTKSLVNDSLMWTIQCRNNTCEIKPATDLYRDKKECVKHWNTRVSQ